MEISPERPPITPYIISQNPSHEELLENSKCTPAEKSEIAQICSLSIDQRKKYANSLANAFSEEKNNTGSLQNKVFLLTQNTIQLEIPKKEQKHDHLLNYMGRKNLLRQMRPEQGFALAISAITQKNIFAFKKIIFNFKTIPSNKPFDHTELLSIKTSKGETLGHLATQADQQEAIQYIAYNHRELLETTNDQGETLVHTASRYSSRLTISYLLDFSKKLFGKKNLKGETPLDLEGGPEICRTIALAIVEQDIQKGEETLQKALTICKQIKGKTPQKGEIPFPKTKISPKLQMETLSF